MREIPILFERKSECCGCTACVSVCAKSAIAMKPDEEGFLYPQINEARCVGCRLCLMVCPMKKSR